MAPPLRGIAAGPATSKIGAIKLETEQKTLAGLDRTDFLMALAREKVDVFHVDLEQLAREISHE